MRDITTNSSESQNKNQKTTPVIESFFEPNDSSISLPGVVLQIWLELRYGNITFSDELDFDPRELQSIWSDENSGSIS